MGYKIIKVPKDRLQLNCTAYYRGHQGESRLKGPVRVTYIGKTGLTMKNLAIGETVSKLYAEIDLYIDAETSYQSSVNVRAIVESRINRPKSR